MCVCVCVCVCVCETDQILMQFLHLLSVFALKQHLNLFANGLLKVTEDHNYFEVHYLMMLSVCSIGGRRMN